jgi:hypothetical protein
MTTANRYMNGVGSCGIAMAGLLLCAHVASAQDLSRYRTYALASSVESIVATSGLRGDDAKTLHSRPAKIQELEWRAPYVSSTAVLVDPVRAIAFSFVDDALFQIVVSYDRDRTEGLTNGDIVELLTTSYGAPVPRSGKPPAVSPAVAPVDTVVVAQWETPVEMLTLVRGVFSPEFRLILVSKELGARARAASREALRLDAVEAPRREADERKKDAAQAVATREKTRTTNKAAFRP